MNRTHRALVLAFTVLVAIMVASCGDDDDTGTNPVGPGVSWTIRSTGTNATLFDVAFKDSLWVAVGQRGVKIGRAHV